MDREAKKAVEGLTSDIMCLPSYLRKPLLTNPSAIKRAHNDRLKHKWTTVTIHPIFRLDVKVH